MRSLIPLFALASLACIKPGGIQAPAAIDDLAAGNQAFAGDLYRVLAEDDDDNLFFSPTSISVALGMTWAGAAGTTHEAMATALRLPPDEAGVHAAYGAWMDGWTPDPDAPFELAVANRLWAQRGFGFEDAFMATTDEHYDAGVERLDLQGNQEGSRRRINGWVEEQTHDHIRDLLPPGFITDDSVLVLTNAVYFLGKWELPFPPERTEDAPFTRLDGSEVDTPLMYRGAWAPYAEIGSVQVLQLPYDGDRLSMVVLLPDRPGGLSALERKLGPRWIGGVLDEVRRQEVRIWLPPFELETSYQLGPALTELGMGEAFSMGADFSRMSTEGPLAISDVVHEAFVSVDEEGTEAAAATAVGIVLTSGGGRPPPPPPEFRADHPFVFFIWDEATRSPLFLGRVTDPS